MSAEEPVHLVEDVATGDRFLVYATANGPRIDIRYNGDSPWMTQAQIAELFGRPISCLAPYRQYS